VTDREGKGTGKKGMSNENDEKRAAHIFIYIYIYVQRETKGFSVISVFVVPKRDFNK